MQYGVFMFTTDKSTDPVRLAMAAEERGFESLWVPEHVHIPVDRQTPFPRGGDLPEEYYRLHDPFVALAAAAGATSTIKLGTGICLVTEHEPIELAKSVASLDRISNGRFLFGIGAGWMAEEMEALGTAFKTRWKLTEERIAAMREMWTKDEAEYHGELVDIPNTHVWPKPVQQPHPPVLIGSTSRWARQRVVDWGDGWIPNVIEPAFVERGLNDIRGRAEEAGRDISSLDVSIFGAQEEALDEYERIGATRCIFRLPHAGDDVVLPELDRLAKLIGS